MICSKCGYKSQKGMSDLAAWYHHDCISNCPDHASEDDSTKHKSRERVTEQ